MKIKFQIILMSAVFGLILGCTATNFAQTELPVPIAGGYSRVESNTAETVSAANFAVKKQSKKQKAKIKLTKISKAEKQVVAGLNYRLCLQVETSEKNKKTVIPQTIEAIVFLDLKQNFSLTSWAIAACTDETLPKSNE